MTKNEANERVAEMMRIKTQGQLNDALRSFSSTELREIAKLSALRIKGRVNVKSMAAAIWDLGWCGRVELD